eukprot:TRINITY_DN17480_c0_g1_i1.p1 TRINITY_DN17480_c0_g1~~TRINITY_DN17480_c0_g1_i1.p1  ORF type:complete len:102 (-),score=6.91 TRINITY_DN17480_c0_g1_i1:26-331(-)
MAFLYNISNNNFHSVPNIKKNPLPKLPSQAKSSKIHTQNCKSETTHKTPQRYKQNQTEINYSQALIHMRKKSHGNSKSFISTRNNLDLSKIKENFKLKQFT